MKLKHWSSKLGLASDEVTCFAQDYKGFLWIGISKELNRFDGQSFLPISINDEEPEVAIRGLLSYKKSIYVYTVKDQFFKINTDSFNKKLITAETVVDDNLKAKLEQQINDYKIEVYNGDNFTLTNNGELYRNSKRVPGVFNLLTDCIF